VVSVAFVVAWTASVASAAWDLTDQTYGSDLPAPNSMTTYGWSFDPPGTEALKPDGTFVNDDDVRLADVFDPIQGDHSYTVEFKFNAAGLAGDVMSIRTDPLIDDGTFGMQINAGTINLTDIGTTASVVLNPAALGLDMTKAHIYTVVRYDTEDRTNPKVFGAPLPGDDNIALYIDDYSAPVATRRGGTFGDGSFTRALLQFTNGGNNTEALETLHYFRARSGAWPEPSSGVLALLGAAGLLLRRRA